jgi:hypothetical protein
MMTTPPSLLISTMYTAISSWALGLWLAPTFVKAATQASLQMNALSDEADAVKHSLDVSKCPGESG